MNACCGLQAELNAWLGAAVVESALLSKMSDAMRKDAEALIADAPKVRAAQASNDNAGRHMETFRLTSGSVWFCAWALPSQTTPRPVLPASCLRLDILPTGQAHAGTVHAAGAGGAGRCSSCGGGGR